MKVTIDLQPVRCSTCNLIFALDYHVFVGAVQNNKHFYCPAGHKNFIDAKARRVQIGGHVVIVNEVDK